jgi:hypothetical protein
MNNPNFKYLNELDAIHISVLNDRLYILLDKYILDNKEICVYAMIDKNILKSSNFNLRDLEQFILKNHHIIIQINNSLDYELYASYRYKYSTDDEICINSEDGPVSYSRKELSNLIINHNKNLVIPSSNEYLLEKNKIID